MQRIVFRDERDEAVRGEMLVSLGFPGDHDGCMAAIAFGAAAV